MSKPTSLLKPYLRKLILQTHPDFFHNDSIKKQVNASSLQQLQQILKHNNDNKKSCSLKFYQKSSKQPVTAIFSADSEWIKAQSLFQLCEKMSIPVLPSDRDIVQSMISEEQQKPQQSLKKEFATRLYKEHTSEFQRDLSQKDILNGLIMFDPKVNKNKMARQLRRWLPELQSQRWWGKIPLLVVSEPISKDMTKGMLCVTSSMTLEDIKSYLDQNLESVIREHESEAK